MIYRLAIFHIHPRYLFKGKSYHIEEQNWLQRHLTLRHIYEPVTLQS